MTTKKASFRPNEDLTHDGLLVLSCKTLGELDKGMVELAINEKLRQASEDIEQRGSDGKARTVTIKISMAQVTETDVATEVDVDVKMPPLKSGTTMSQNRPVTGRGRGMAFRATNPERYSQPTIYDESHKKGDEEAPAVSDEGE